ncbi:MAG: 2OG-Fe(II) oxygenase [Gammaproteobacteria bacterium]|nr:2OG-Fe(II) oxygenase [Gammaproteobacteria bacterium]
MKAIFTPEWKNWIKTNIANGQDKDHLFNILIDEDFSYDAIKQEMQFEPTPKHDFTEEWKTWIKTNVSGGHDKNGLFKILLNHGFAYDAIREQMQYEPTIPLDELIDPLKTNIELNEQSGPVQSGEVVDFSKLLIPNSEKFESESLELFLIKDFLNAEECKQLVSALKEQLSADHTSVVGANCDLPCDEYPLFNDIDERLCKLIGIDPSYSESMQGHYCDATDPQTSAGLLNQQEIASPSNLKGHRAYTVTVYLNDVESGGEIQFIDVNLSIKPKAGLAIVWSNLNPDGLPAAHNLGQSMPVIKGCKAVLTKWFRTQSSVTEPPPMFNRDPNEVIPAYTKSGFCKSQLPDALFARIQAFFSSNSDKVQEENVAGGYIVTDNKSKATGSSLIDLSAELRQEIHDNLKASMEQWSGKELLPTYVYGIRIYHRGAILKCHRDRLATHIIGGIINVSQDVDEDWPLVIYDHQHRRHSITLKPGEIVFYESGSLIHGRPSPLNGSAFANLFCHFMPVDYVPKTVINAS